MCLSYYPTINVITHQQGVSRKGLHAHEKLAAHHAHCDLQLCCKCQAALMFELRRLSLSHVRVNEIVSIYTSFLTPARMTRKVNRTTELNHFRTFYRYTLKSIPSKSLKLPVLSSCSFVSDDPPPPRGAGAPPATSQQGPARPAARGACRAA